MLGSSALLRRSRLPTPWAPHPLQQQQQPPPPAAVQYRRRPLAFVLAATTFLLLFVLSAQSAGAPVALRGGLPSIPPSRQRWQSVGPFGAPSRLMCSFSTSSSTPASLKRETPCSGAAWAVRISTWAPSSPWRWAVTFACGTVPMEPLFVYGARRSFAHGASCPLSSRCYVQFSAPKLSGGNVHSTGTSAAFRLCVPPFTESSLRPNPEREKNGLRSHSLRSAPPATLASGSCKPSSLAAAYRAGQCWTHGAALCSVGPQKLCRAHWTFGATPSLSRWWISPQRRQRSPSTSPRSPKLN